jgi:hypothetical protein
MTQVFGDAVRDAFRRSGIGGVIVLWMRTIADAVVSLFKAYSDEPRERVFKFAAGSAIIYALALVLAIAYGAVRYGEFYQPPAFTHFAAPDVSEDVLLSAYNQALADKFGDYRNYARGVAVLLSIWLGIVAGLFGSWQRSLLHGAALLIALCGVTIAALSLLPTMWFPLDRYPVGALWTMSGLPLVAAGVGLLVSIIWQFLQRWDTPFAA